MSVGQIWPAEITPKAPNSACVAVCECLCACAPQHAPWLSCSSLSDPPQVLQPRQGARRGQEEKQLHVWTAGAGVWAGRMGLPALPARPHQQQWPLPGAGVRWQHHGGILPGGLGEPQPGSALLPDRRAGVGWEIPSWHISIPGFQLCSQLSDTHIPE